MKSRMTVILGALLISFMAGCSSPTTTPLITYNSGWLDAVDFKAHLAELEQKEDGKNFWDRGHWIDKADGRWKDGKPQFKIQYSEVPANNGYLWYWWFGQSKENFGKRITEMADKGMTMVHHQSYERPDGTLRYQAVWQQLTPPKSEPEESAD